MNNVAKNKFLLLKYTLIVILAYFQIYSFEFYLECKSESMFILGFVGLFFLTYKFFQNEKRVIILSLFCGGFFSSAFALGKDLYIDNCINFWEYGYVYLGKNIVSFIGLSFLCAILFSFILHLGDKTVREKYEETPKINANALLFSIPFFILCWIPVFLSFFPGILSYDTYTQIPQALGIAELSNHNPVLHTLILKFCLSFERIINVQNLGLILYAAIQMSFLAFVFSYTIKILYIQKVKTVYLILLAAYYALCPTIALFSIIPTKDIIFSGLFLLLCIEMWMSLNCVISRKKEIAVITGLCILLSFFRNNAIYVIIVVLAAEALFVSVKRKRVLAELIVTLAVYFAINNLVFPLCGVKQSPTHEKLSVPISQMAAVTVSDIGDISNEDYESVVQFIPDVNKYNPRLADEVKTTFNDSLYEENKMAFWKLWIKLGIKNPRKYTEAFLTLNLPFWFPDAQFPDMYSNRMYIETYRYNIEEYPVANYELFPLVKRVYNEIAQFQFPLMRVPVVEWLFSLSAPIWLVFGGIFIQIYLRRKDLFVISLACVTLWLTYLLGPVSNYRYLLPLLLVIPIIFVLVFGKKVKNNEQ